MKVSYICGPNFEALIRAHNAKILKVSRSKNVEAPKTCDCSRNNPCPVEGKCLESNVIYEAEVSHTNSNTEPKIYRGLASTSFKIRYTNHKSDIKNRARKGTELSTYIWALKEKNEDFSVKWKIISKEMCYNKHTL